MKTESFNHVLNENQVSEICARAFLQWNLEGKRLLCIIPDHTRTCPMGILFRVIYNLLADSVKILDFLIALGTHPPMSRDAILHHAGISSEDYEKCYSKARFFNHAWQNPEQLRHIGTITADEMETLSGGLMHEKVEIAINKRVFDYDQILIIGPVFPHEVVGFSGGNKYLFPGIAGPEIINSFHWLGALITSPMIIGTKHTPVRRVVNRAAAMLPIQKKCISMVVHGEKLAGLFIDTPEAAWEIAADLSEKLHIVYKDRPFHTVLSCAPVMYDDLWTGAKCMYKLEPVVAEGGELIIYAPHIKEVSVSHGKYIEAIGYHVRDYFVKQAEKFQYIPGGVKAHSTHVKGVGTYEKGIEKSRIDVILATGISERVCRQINLGYRDPGSIDLAEFGNREEEGILFVEKAGEMLYRLRNNPF